MFDIAFSILAGHGVTLPFAWPSDLSTTGVVAINAWPPGLPVVLAGLTSLLGRMDWAKTAVESFSVLLFFISWFSILECLKGSLSLRARFLIAALWAFGPDPLFSMNTPILTAGAFFAGATAVAVHFHHHRRHGAALGAASGLLMALAFMFHYATWPYLLVVPIASLWMARRNGDRTTWKFAGVHFAVGLIAMIAVSLWMRHETGKITFLQDRYVGPGTLALPWKNLLTAYPFFSLTLGLERIWLFASSFGRVMTYGDHWPVKMHHWILIIPAVPLAAAYGLSVRNDLRTRPVDSAPAPKNIRCFVTLAGIVALLVTLGMLSVMTLKIKDFTGRYLLVPRYYAPLLPFIAVALASFLFPITAHKRTALASALAQILAGLLILSSFTVVLRARYFFWGLETRRSHFIDRDKLGALVKEKAGGLPVVFFVHRLTDEMIRELILLRIPACYLDPYMNYPDQVSTLRPVFVVMSRLPKREPEKDQFFAILKDAKIKMTFDAGTAHVVGFVLEPGTSPLQNVPYR